MNKTAEKCSNCKFFQQTLSADEANGRGWGKCHRYAPRPFSVVEESWRFPEIYDDSWCGEFEEMIGEENDRY